MTDASINFFDQELVLDRSGALYVKAHKVLVFSDLHFEKGSSFVRRGLTLPPYDSRKTLSRMDEVIARYKPTSIIALGDSFHDGQARERLDEQDAKAIAALTAACEFIWIIGNHDPHPPQDLGGSIADEVSLGRLVFRHEPARDAAPGEVIGHFHPCAAIRARGRHLRRPCFVTDGARLILPSFGAYTGGLNVLDNAYAEILSGPLSAFLLGRDGSFKMSQKKLLPDRPRAFAEANRPD